MSVSILQLISLVALFFLGLGLGSMYLLMRVRELHAEIQALKAQCAGVAASPSAPVASRKRMPYEAAEEVIDAMSVLDAAYEKGLLQVEYVQNVKAHLAKALESGTKRASAPARDDKEL